MDIFLKEKHRIVRNSVKSFAQKEILPIAKEIDQEQRFPWKVVEKMGKAGYLGIQAPKELGGAAMDTVSYIIVIEEISKASASLGLCASVHNSVALYPILKFGTREQEEYHKPVAYRHDGEEFIYVLEGKLELTLDNKKHKLISGESIKFNSNIPHKLKSLGDVKTKCLVTLYTP